jgi:hypothetical protein
MDPAVDWTYINLQHQRLTERINQWVASPPMLRLPATYYNATYWLDMLERYNQNQNQNIVPQ